MTRARLLHAIERLRKRALDIELDAALSRLRASGSQPYPRPEVDGDRGVAHLTPFRRKQYLQLVRR